MKNKHYIPLRILHCKDCKHYDSVSHTCRHWKDLCDIDDWCSFARKVGRKKKKTLK